MSNNLESYQLSLSEDEILEVQEIRKVEDNKNTKIYFYIGLGVLLLILIGFFMIRKKKTN